jgi:Tfp pilus assembly PilM family ATPase
MKPRTKRVVASIPSFAAFVTVLDFPQMSDDDLARAVSFKAREVVPLPIDDVALDFVKVGD